ncbi:MAG TPA: ABC transporter permease [Micromonosporaceae bacterium]|nr:ABC transporter permease [Micromonosporaceae bacterium]HCU50379.1 ABC transporter permease [Micromonosporaceae bacterium]
MLRFIIKRLLVALLTLAAVDVITFGIFFAVPSSPAQVMCSKDCSAERLARVNAALGLDKPKLTQFVEFNKGLVLGRDIEAGGSTSECPAPCLGYSFRTSEAVTKILARGLPVTVSIVLGAFVLWIIAGVGLGIFSALRRGTFADKVAIGVALIGASMPVYFFALILLGLVVFGMGLMDYPHFVPITENPLLWAKGLILPWVALAFVQAAGYARYSRAQMLETLSEDYIRTARAIGLPKRTVHLKHALRAAITPVITLAGLDLGVFLGGVAITETIFGMHGIGWQSVNAVLDLNLPVVMAVVLVAAFFVVVSNAVVDVLYAFVDPRVRLS